MAGAALSYLIQDYFLDIGEVERLSHPSRIFFKPVGIWFYAVNWCVSRWNGRDTMDVINFFISRPGGLTREKE